MKIKICVPVIGKTFSKFLKNLDRVQENFPMVELRVDEIKNLSEKDLLVIRKRTTKESILTSRKTAIIIKALDLKFDFVDVEFSLFPELNLSKDHKSKVILSFHDYEKTPSLKKLTEIVDNMRKFNVGVLKIATMINCDEDIKTLFKILLNKKENEKIIVIGMGEKGQVTRIIGPLLGSFLTFASSEFGKSAPGQIDINMMKSTYKLLVTNH